MQFPSTLSLQAFWGSAVAGLFTPQIKRTLHFQILWIISHAIEYILKYKLVMEMLREVSQQSGNGADFKRSLVLHIF